MNTKRLMISVTPELEHVLNQIKREQFGHVSHSEMLRVLIQKGLDVTKQKPFQERGNIRQKMIER